MPLSMFTCWIPQITSIAPRRPAAKHSPMQVLTIAAYPRALVLNVLHYQMYESIPL